MYQPHVDLSDPAIPDSINDVKNEGTPTAWALLSYVPKTSKLKVVETGTGNVEELLNELSDAKIYFAYLRFEMSETWKYVYITYCGDAVPGTAKGYFHNHCTDVEEYLKKNGFHFSAQINARCERDLEEAEIIKALNKTSTFIRARSAKDAQAAKQSVKETRDQFWKTQTQKDSQHKEDMARHQKEKEEELIKAREMTAQKISQTAEQLMAEKEAGRQAQADEFHREQSQRQNEQQRRLDEQRTKVFSNLEATRGGSSADVHSSQSSYQAPPRQPARGAPVSNSTGSEVQARPPVRQAAVRQPEPQPEPEPEPETTYQEPEPQAEPQADAWQEEQQPEAQPEDTYQEQAAPQEAYDQQPAEQPQSGSQAKALFDYDGQEPTDLSFREGDIINVLDQSDPSGWWQGELNGATGTFPSNFVELI